ncbi:hypothetical protein KIN20_017443 [Parelaphostrongylus tenuis]|uniref:Uncharacterized protein n=1 Tax=Parelaphostrongylus tenuis TaxID=148309 RepID=A0AAD5QQS1_PARTN|nr:hypothetical protein KIN20_017443 [Parelaphostrongylus tenuis]
MSSAEMTLRSPSIGDNNHNDIIFLDEDVAPATTSPVPTRVADVAHVETQLCDDVDVKPASTEDLKMTRFLLQDPPESSEKTGWLLRAAAAYYCNGCAQDINNGRVELLKKDDSSEESIGDTKRQSDRQAYDDEAQIGYCPHIFT